MKIKYCLPVIRNTKKEVLRFFKKKGFHFYEVWIDYIEDLDDQFIADIAKKYEKKLIFLFRRKNLEKIKSSLDKRKHLISIASKFNVYFDVDFLTQHEELEFLKENPKIKLILSYHNYKETPQVNYLENLINKMKRYDPYIYKIAAFCKTEEDALALLNFLIILKKKKLKYIVLGMGEKGLITRIFGPILGNEITFAPFTLEEKSASGQFTKKQMEDIFSKIP